jgi:hypothetical protein
VAAELPQGLKPASLWDLGGTTEVVPFPNLSAAKARDVVNADFGGAGGEQQVPPLPFGKGRNDKFFGGWNDNHEGQRRRSLCRPFLFVYGRRGSEGVTEWPSR